MGNTVPYKSWLERQEAWLLSPLILANNKDSLCHFSAEERDEPIRTYAISSLHNATTISSSGVTLVADAATACSHIHQSSVGLGWGCQGRSFFSIDTFDVFGVDLFGGLLRSLFFSLYISAW